MSSKELTFSHLSALLALPTHSIQLGYEDLLTKLVSLVAKQVLSQLPSSDHTGMGNALCGRPCSALAWLAQGFELNPGQWLPRKMLVATKAMKAWTQKRAVDGQQHASSPAEWARLSAQAKFSAGPRSHVDGIFQQVLW